MKIPCLAFVLLLTISCRVALGQSATVTAYAGSGTYGIQDQNNAGTYTYQTSYASGVGEYYAPGAQVDIIQFLIPTISTPYSFTSASLYNELYGYTGATPANNADLYALGVSATPTVSAAQYYNGPADPSPTATLIQQSYLTGTLTGSSGNGNPGSGNQDPIYTSIGGSAALAAYLNTVDPNNAAAGEYLTLRINYDVTPTVYEGYNLLTAGAGGSTEKPTLTLNFASVPEPSTYALLGFGGFALWGLARRKIMRSVS